MDIEEYKKLVVGKFMTKPAAELEKEFKTKRICWAFVMWTYEQLGLPIRHDGELKALAQEFRRIGDDKNGRKSGPYKFPDIVLFRHTKFCSHYLGRHAGIMLNNEDFVHMSAEAGGINFTSRKIWPWNCVPYMVIRQKTRN